ncbi:hypothetical protein [Sporomusa aerivorans]|uniref:hypothetical protein n=1 Tax=Sporomusa aerivorans TaxID=204936 RepID=UPI003529F339
MIKLIWLDWDNNKDGAEFATMEETKQFISEYLATQPLVMDSIKIIDGANVQTIDFISNNKTNYNGKTILTWLNKDVESDMAIFDSYSDTIDFIKEYIWTEPVVYNSIKLMAVAADHNHSYSLVDGGITNANNTL